MNKALVVSDKKKILIRDEYPDRLTTVIPTSRKVNYKGVDLVVCPHELDETKVLNNLGYHIPSPIETYYRWPSRYPKPMHAQSVTSGNLTLDPRHFVLNEIGCVDSETEFLSPTGWVKISQYAGEAVLQYWPETGATDFVKSPEYVKLPCAEMIQFCGPGIDQLLSYEHRVLMYSNDNEPFVVRAERLFAAVYPGSSYPTEVDGSGRVLESEVSYSKKESTNGFKYCFMVPSTFLVLRRNGCIFCTGNTGKTLSVLWAFDYLKSIGKADKMLVVTPLSTMESVWANEVWEHMPHLQTQVLYGDAKKRVAQREFPADIYIINHDGIKVPEILASLIKRDDITVLCVDELADFKNAGTDRFKAMKKLGAGREYFWGLTGTPIPNKVTDAWAQCQLINPARVPKYFGQFRESVMRKVSQFKWVPRDNALDVVKEAMQPATLFRRDECMDLPPTMWSSRFIEMSTDQKKSYKQMMATLVAEAGAGQIVAVNEAVKMGKLLQIAAGVCYGPAGEILKIDSPDRIEELKSIIEESQGKVIVFVPLTGALHSVADELKKTWQTEVIYGDVSKSERARIFAEFKQPDGLHVIVAHPKVMAHGLTLVEANTIIWFIPTNNPNDYTQANGRITRPGQKRNTFIIHLEGSAVEQRMYKALKDKGNLQGVLLDLIKEDLS